MKIRKLCSNEPDVLRDIPVEDGNMSIVKTLGILWKSKENVFTFQLVAPPYDDNLNQSSDILQHSQNRPVGNGWLKF